MIPILKIDIIQYDNTVTLNVKIAKRMEYLYFQAGSDSIYIGPKGDPSKSKPDNVLRALEYSRDRTDHYLRSLDELLSFLPARMRDQYLTKQIARLQKKIRCYESMLTDD